MEQVKFIERSFQKFRVVMSEEDHNNQKFLNSVFQKTST